MVDRPVISFDACTVPAAQHDTGAELYPCGLRCHRHAPATQAGRVVPTPTPFAPSERHTPPDYGRATTDPLGRTIPGTARTGMIPRRPCTECVTRQPIHVGHDGPHA
jgi:hypothetical protein